MDLGLMLSFILRNETDDKEGVDYALLAPIPNIIYDNIAKYVKECFNEYPNLNFDEETFDTDISDKKVVYVYQENLL